MYSLYCARQLIDEAFLLLESDLIYEPRALHALLAVPDEDTVLLSGPTAAGDEVVLEALATANLELHTRAVDPDDLQVDAFTDAETTGVDRGEAGVVGRPVDVVENAPNLIDTEDGRQGLGRARAI